MYEISYITASRQLVNIHTPSRATAFRVFADFARAGHKPRIFRAQKGAVSLIV